MHRMHRPPHSKQSIFLPAAVLLLLCWIGSTAFGQDALPVNVKFDFRVPNVEPRFVTAVKADVERQISEELARTCADRFPYWAFQAQSATQPLQLAAWLTLKNSKWSLNARLLHPAGKLMKDTWDTVLYAPGDLDTQVLPKDGAWTAKIKGAFDDLLQNEGRNELLSALQEYAPLGNDMAPVATQPTAVLALDYGKYKSLSMGSFKIFCNWPGHGTVILHSVATGQPNNFTPENPRFQGIWVAHNTWEFTRKTDDISNHLADLPSLKAFVFYLEDVGSSEANVSVAPQ